MAWCSSEQGSNQEVVMFVLALKSICARAANWAVESVLGSLARVSNLTTDDDMCLLLRVELPRTRTSADLMAGHRK
jgi:hypothetical protein